MTIMKTSVKGPQQLIAPIPHNDDLRFLLAIFRRMGAHGLKDATVNNAMMRRFGGAYRQPYLLMQTLMVDLSRHCRLSLTIAPCCCRQMTTDEAQLIAIFETSENDPSRALYLLSDLTGNRECHGVLATIDAVSAAFASLGCRLSKPQ
jgi:hypothetical protein